MIGRARSLIATYEDMAELIRLGAYSAGTDAKVDQAIHYHDRLEEFLNQPKSEHTKIGEGFIGSRPFLELKRNERLDRPRSLTQMAN